MEARVRLSAAAACRILARTAVTLPLMFAACTAQGAHSLLPAADRAQVARGSSGAPDLLAPLTPISAPTADAATAEPTQVETATHTGWRAPDVERRAFPQRVERWRSVVRDVLAEEWEHGTLTGPAGRIDDDLVLAVMEQASGGNPRALSWAGAMGLMQVMDFTFALMMAGSESMVPQIDKAAFWDERSNVRAGIRYLALAMQYHDGDVYWSLASYNAGIGNARTWRRAGLYAVPPIGGFVETANYAPRIMRSYMRHRPDVLLYVPDVMPEEHVPGAIQLLRDSRRGRL
ncbi:MAG TPA: lytic transglycosylase domain-containing protein [Chloroflexota bacterium]|nr:lytic transglycosylase domain-containing protein [Chloroflexota bacterium]